VPQSPRSAVHLLLLLILGLTLLGCPTRRGGGGGGGGSDDDDSAGDDDDGTEDDDDAVTDDDDAVDDDDDAVDDDDDVVQTGYGDVSVISSYLETVVDAAATTTVTLSNLDAGTLTGSVSLSETSGWSLSGSSSVTLYGFETTTRTLTFAPWYADSWYTQVQFFHDGSNSSPVSTGVDGYSYEDIPTSETDCSDGLDNDGDGYYDCEDFDCTGDAACPVEDCTDGLDNDGDGYYDCDDYDCAGDPACDVDPCCSTSGSSTTWTTCMDSAAITCVCGMDAYCCDGSGWDSACQSEYVSDCGATTCGP
jgi:hypothetical protein